MAGSKLSMGFKITYFILFLIAFSYLITIIDPDLLDFAKILNILDYFLAILEVALFNLAPLVVGIAVPIHQRLAAGFSIPYINFNLSIGTALDDASYSEIQQRVAYIAQTIFPQSSIFRTENIDPIAEILEVYGIFFIIIAIPLALLSAIGFLTRGEARLAQMSFIAMQVILIVAMYVPNFSNDSQRMILIDLSLPVFEGTVDSLVDDLIMLVTSEVFMIGLGLYILLELAFQASYAINVLDPMVDREKRIRSHLKRIEEFKPETKKSGSMHVDLGSSSQTSKKYDLLASSYLREMITDRVFKKGVGRYDEKTTMRLQSYIRSLRRTDRKFLEKVTASSAQPSTWGIVKNIIPLIIGRVVMVVILSYLILNPAVIMSTLIEEGTGLLQFPALQDSIELTQPEFRTVILFNILLILLAFSAIVHTIFVHTPEHKEVEVKKVETIVDFQDVSEIADEEEPLEGSVS